MALGGDPPTSVAFAPNGDRTWRMEPLWLVGAMVEWLDGGWGITKIGGMRGPARYEFVDQSQVRGWLAWLAMVVGWLAWLVGMVDLVANHGWLVGASGCCGWLAWLVWLVRVTGLVISVDCVNLLVTSVAR